MESFVQLLVKLYDDASLSSLVLIELSFFCLCLHLVVLPQKHRQSKSVKLGGPPSLVWRTILDIDRYPLWRSHVVSVVGHQHIDPQSSSSKTTYFFEYVARTRQHLAEKQKAAAAMYDPNLLQKTRIRWIEMTRLDECKLIRVDRAKHGTSFEREWEIIIKPSPSGASTILTLTETVKSEGHLARWLGPVLGFHRVSQRFLSDLAHEIDRLQKQRVLSDNSEVLCESPVTLHQA
ncbi:hypothetical protein BX666DRAFT_2026989 [Dichotomocladium elegans]|nr:hypothetical protein BX666DRAFT_2026989 [Dichotomocladium elegans]